ncbi:MAG: Sec-independent protein translocase subunit TatA/TatB [Thermoguttaceae bacterium]
MGISPFHIILIAILGVLIFGRRLPEVAKQIGSGLMEFRKGVDELKNATKLDSPKAQLREKRDAEHVEDVTKLERREVEGTRFEL